ncbi:MAG: dTDP-4-deoxyrhamnose 3,5 epimerase [Parcubacteria group bacterium GW2011_GWC1_42_11]|uniref:dTDP-4-dehydrorhamnose 3,5-epimerase n=1 Tax=Candidatus Nomurabacteria bacterium GW2011_GWC2_42_20 TaxID=1618756 RepID=A0A0G1BNR9_9BACT|nr:MAG: dTDP-4-deoxyrhamnose 3,5 epimerase [Parcubacteria group bacterium GW2011_GWC1_42_11]KKS47926.1 MAG: dTDP-4-deoxyrhamnose 3,5 epimerase [Candidatus Nomurabacteria bacterium GW2011_GWC2_42_20]KKS59090.1 MAG: dTDP-4-deoxyrhamnose 3,5 epimerase [Candidatus Nomurabacteria bacterium GW2011_GWA2_42_41]KKT09693.1 MAG: dTDP-4-deoxyrhamnose 3,5 epimerase [Candidatus Nomurabacteria bacterium GW2011_GWB1_43_20]TAN36631.1 MAG: dTDP-4-dehydrorhamnose 3,5-epimerase [Patescibacteria group bacterium]HB
MTFIFKKQNIPEVVLIETPAFPDDRGYFSEWFKASEFERNGLPTTFLQDNFSHSKKGVIRGLHYQLNPKAQGKLVRVLKGNIIDIAVDIRRDSPTFLKSVAVELSDKNNNMLFIPAGFAHGFVTLSDEVRFLYKCTEEYSKEYERGIRYDDPEININWGISNPLVSEKDLNLPLAKDAEVF